MLPCDTKGVSWTDRGAVTEAFKKGDNAAVVDESIWHHVKLPTLKPLLDPFMVTVYQFGQVFTVPPSLAVHVCFVLHTDPPGLGLVYVHCQTMYSFIKLYIFN